MLLNLLILLESAIFRTAPSKVHFLQRMYGEAYKLGLF